MFGQTVDVTYEPNDEEVTVRGVVEDVSKAEITLCDNINRSIKIPMHEVNCISVIDEDDHHEFVNEMLASRRNDDIAALARSCINKFDLIIKYCPETRETLAEHLIDEIHTMIEMDQE